MKAASLIIALFLAMALNGCVSLLQKMKGPAIPIADQYREKALAHEKEKEYRQAIVYWQVISKLDTKDIQASKNIQALKQAALKAAKAHYQQGLEHYRTGDRQTALREFLKTLRHDPGHERARFYLKQRLNTPGQTLYRVKPGDSFTRIADDIYQDPSKAYMIAYFNDMDPEKPLLIDTELVIPTMPAELLVPRSDIRVLFEKAQKAYENKRYNDVHALAEAILKEVPNHAQTRRLVDAAHFDQGKALMARKQYLPAVAQFKQVSPDYPGRSQALAEAQNRINRQVIEDKLATAGGHLKKQEWRQVISVTEEILQHDPDNDQAKMLFSNASYKMGKTLLDRGDNANAIAVLTRIEPTYEDTGQLLALARARLKSQAETLYREGVKHFINEDLKQAITTWEKALELNPEHAKARQDMENARRLLEKLRALDKK